MSATAATGTGTRRQKWHYPQPPSPRILHLPRRGARRKPPRSGRPSSCDSRSDGNQNSDTKLEALFDRERLFSKGGHNSKGSGGSAPAVLFDDEGELRRREGGGGPSVAEEEKWRFQAEVLRAECNLLRMEKEIVVRKLDRSRVYLERTLRSAIETLISGRKKICEGKDMAAVLEEEIHNLVEKLEEVGKSSRAKYTVGAREGSNFDQQVTILQRRLDKLGSSSEEKCAEKIRKMAVESLSVAQISEVEAEGDGIAPNCDSVEILTRKIEGLSKHMLLERMEEEYDSIMSAAESSGSNSTASTSKRVQCLGHYVPFIRHSNQEMSGRREGGTGTCSGHCKAVVRRIVEQVRVETEQWSQLQEMLGQVRDEMEELQASRDFWEDRALGSDAQNQSFRSAVQEWRQRAILSDAKATELQLKVSMLRDEIDSLKKGLAVARSPMPLVPGSLDETEKRVLTSSLKENHRNGVDMAILGIDRIRNVQSSSTNTSSSSSRGFDLKRSPLRDIGNSSGHSARLMFPLSSHLSSK